MRTQTAGCAKMVEAATGPVWGGTKTCTTEKAPAVGRCRVRSLAEAATVKNNGEHDVERRRRTSEAEQERGDTECEGSAFFSELRQSSHPREPRAPPNRSISLPSMAPRANEDTGLSPRYV